MARDQLESKGLPANVDAERIYLGAVILNDEHFTKSTGSLKAEDFTLEKHRKIFMRMGELHTAGTHIDRVTVANELMRFGELESVGGLSYLASLDDGLPDLPHVDNYVQIIRDKSALRRIIYLNEKAMNLAVLQEDPPAKILSDLCKAFRQMELGLDQKPAGQSAGEIVEESGGLNAFMTESLKLGISTGFPQIDEAVMGLQEGCHYIIAGRTGSGKTGIAENIAINVAKQGHPVVIFSLEMKKQILLRRAVCAEAEVSYRAFTRNLLTPEQRNAARHALMEIMDLPLYIEAPVGMTICEFSALVDRVVLQRKARLIILDYLQLLNPDPEIKYTNPTQTVTSASSACRLAAWTHGISSIALSQLSRPADKRKPGARPQLAELRQSGGIENDAEAVLFIHREEMWDHNNQSAKGKAEIIVAKARTGTLGTLHIGFKGYCYKFTDPGVDPDPPHAYGSAEDKEGQQFPT